MPAPLWNGHITFGLISVPVALVPAVRSSGTPLRLVHAEGDCLGRIRIRKVCEIDEQPVYDQDVGRGYEMPSGAVVPVTDADLDHIPLPTAHTIEMLGTLPANGIDIRQLGAGAYYLAAGNTPAAMRPYLLLARALARRRQAVVVKLAVRGDRERIALMRPVGDALTLSTLRWPDEIRPPDTVAPAQAEIGDDELDAALDLIAARTAESLGELPGLVDHYDEALTALVEAKLQDRRVSKPARYPPPVDLMSLLRNSVQDAHAARREHHGGGGAPPP
ncbi:hypothetical protein P9869_35725 [Streptomyces ossamyceticus]|nr:hypothetical protein [Streptomyces ossamyceticus]